MELCSCCSRFDSCEIPKRKSLSTASPCELFSLPSDVSRDLYDGIADEVSKVIAYTRASVEEECASRPPTYNIDIPMEVPGDDLLGGIPRDLYLRFLNADLADSKSRDAFFGELGRFGDGFGEFYNHVLEATRNGDHDFAGDLAAVKADLGSMVERWEKAPEAFGGEKTDLDLISNIENVVGRTYYYAIEKRTPPVGAIRKHMEEKGEVFPCPEGVEVESLKDRDDVFRLNAWLDQGLSPFFRRSDDGVISLMMAVDFARWYATLYYLFAQDVIEKQEIKRCPVCRAHHRPAKKGPPGATCGKDSCRQAWRRRKQRDVD